MITGQRHERLTAISQTGGRSSDGHLLWLCECDCGGTKVVPSNSLRHGGIGSCGCLRREAQRARVNRDGAWNEGKSYAIGGGERCYKTRHGWAKAAIRHYGNKCEKCGWDKARCDVHHREPKARGGLHTIQNAIVICPNCHRLTHEPKT